MITIPTIAQIQAGIQSDIESELGVTLPTFARAFLYALTLSLAGLFKMIYLATAFLQKNIWVDTADSESIGGTLERFGRVKLNRNPFPAVAAVYTVRVSGTVGSTIPANQTFISDGASAHPGSMFILDTAYTLASNPDSINLRALTPGVASQLATGDFLNLTSPVLGVDTAVSVTAVVTQPLDAEPLETYRAKAVLAYQLQGLGGNAANFRTWSYDAAGVKQTYPYAASGQSGYVNLYVEAIPADSTDGFGTPSQAILDAVTAVIEQNPDTTLTPAQRGRRPLGVFQVNYLPITVHQVNINITGFAGLTIGDQLAIFFALDTLVKGIRPFVAGADIPGNQNDILDTNKIIAAVLGVLPGSTFGAVTLTVGGTPVSSFTFLNGDIPHLNTVTYI